MIKKILILIASSFILTSCIELVVGSAVVATGTWVAKQGEAYDYYEKKTDIAWELTSQFASEKGTVTYSSENEGIIKIDYADGGNGTFTVERITAKTTKVSLKSYRYKMPSNSLTDTFYPELREKLQ